MRSSNAVQSSESDQAAARDDEDTVAGANETSSDENDTPVGKIGIPGPVQWSLACPPSTLQLSALPSPNRRQRPSVKYLVETMDDFEDLQDSGLMRWLPSRPNGSFDAWRCVSAFLVLLRELADHVEKQPKCSYIDECNNKVQVWYPQYISECLRCRHKQGEPLGQS